MRKKILVTGGLGYIGSHTTIELINEGYEPIIIDNLSNSIISNLNRIMKITNKEVEFEKIDLLDYNSLLDFFKRHKIDGVLHFAALKSVVESTKEPLLYFENNVIGIINLLKAMHENKVSNLVFSSSCTVYGNPDYLPIKESHPFKEPLSPYASTKQMCERIIKDVISYNKNMNVIILRYFNPIGAHPSGLIGELPLEEPNNLVPYITQTCAGVRNVLKIYGKDYDTPDGTCIRDFIHIMDLVHAHIVSLERLLNKKMNSNLEVFNIGTGRGYSVFEVVKIFEKVNKVKVNYIFTDRRPGDVDKVWADVSKANKILNWKAKYTIEDALRDAWNWEKNYRNIK